MVVSFRLAARWWAVTGRTNSSHADLHAPPTSPWVRCGYATIGAVSSLVEAGRGRVKRVIYPPGRQWSRGHGAGGGRRPVHACARRVPGAGTDGGRVRG